MIPSPRILRVLRFVLTALLLAVVATGAHAADELAKITVVGTQTVQAGQVVGWTGLRVGDSVSQETIATAIRRLFETGKFSDIFVYRAPAEGGVEIIFNVTENPRLAEVRYEGLKKIKEDDLQEQVDLMVGDFAVPSKIRRSRDAIRDKYRSEGYYNAKVEAVTTPQADGRVALVYHVTEGDKVKVHKIFFEGNEAFTRDHLKGVMKTKEDGFFRGGTFKEPEFEEDLERIRTEYRDHGYLDADVARHEIEFLEEKNHIDITIHVVEGEQYSVGDLSWSGNTVFGDERIEPLIVLRKGDIFRESDYQLTLQNLRTLYWDQGYIYITITPKRDIHEHAVDVSFSIREGSPARVRRIEITGNTKTHEDVIRREMRIRPGDLFVNSELRNSQRDIFQLGFFNDVRVDFKQAPSPDDIDLQFEVEERQTGQFTMGVGFSQQTQASGFFNIGENNFLGRGQSLQFAWQFGRRRNFLDISFTEPWFMGTPTLVGVELFNRFSNDIRDYYDNRSKGFAIRLGRPIPAARYTRASVRYAFTQTTLRNFDPYYVQTLDNLERELGAEGLQFQRLDKVDWPQTTSGLTFTVLRNSTDNPFFPTRGSRSTVTYTVNGGPLGGDLDYQRLLADYDMYEPLPLRFAMHIGASAGQLAAYGSTPQVPDYERFRLGGNRFYKLRGYRDLEVVPRGNPSFVGGTFFTTITTEILFPISRAVHVLGFVDQGDTWNSFSEADLTNLRTGAGFGIRLEVPLVGRIGLDYGYGFDKRNPGWEAHFNFGTIF
jgi:outer membrane protein insertion porin family